ncbi:iron transporter [Burkholderia stagnalis]|uniref:NRAMP family divalent metal transporter n=1 Tax=Burkholderia stagnalis TaxID=1503054 RepID=UPI00075FA20E|nr:divalent metal cation transporter [Burkholderia stagnalis]KWK50913.1 iron transporter [Burkholderia stagnalis]KWK52046.1 iron transporter [Burkholderia stagnalis]KWN66756.1 iron transporter [Burkholderia stagnalis]
MEREIYTSDRNPDSADTSWLSKLGPGLITGAADDDPSGIATYSQAGAQFGFNLLWTVLLTYPLMVAIQLVSARIGRVSGHGLATNLRRHYPPSLLYGVVILLLVANTINIAADLRAMGAAVNLLIGGPARAYTVALCAISLTLQIFVPYRRYVRVLKWLTLVLFAYVGVVFAVRIPWSTVALRTILPQFSPSADYITTLVAVFGTTISPYLFFWQASQEVEELNATEQQPLVKKPAQSAATLGRIRVDTVVGMGFSNVIAFFIILTTAVTLHAHHVTDIQTAAQAASALKPIAGNLAFFLFGVGIIGTGMLALPVLAGSAAYSMAGTFGWKNSLALDAQLAKRFYGIIALATIVGLALDFTSLDPIKALFWSAVINGVTSVPIMVLMMLMATNPNVVGTFVAPLTLRILGWLSTAVMAAAVFAMFLFL